jgi:hypothetical protein
MIRVTGSCTFRKILETRKAAVQRRETQRGRSPEGEQVAVRKTVSQTFSLRPFSTALSFGHFAAYIRPASKTYHVLAVGFSFQQQTPMEMGLFYTGADMFGLILLTVWLWRWFRDR